MCRQTHEVARLARSSRQNARSCARSWEETLVLVLLYFILGSQPPEPIQYCANEAVRQAQHPNQSL
jgi:hypothetical protein